MRRYAAWIAAGAVIGAIVGALIPLLPDDRDPIVVERRFYQTTSVRCEGEPLLATLIESKWAITKSIEEALAVARSPKLSVEQRSLVKHHVVAFVLTGNWGATHYNLTPMMAVTYQAPEPVFAGQSERPVVPGEMPDAVRQWIESDAPPFEGTKVESALKIARSIEQDAFRADALAFVSAVQSRLGDDDSANQTLDEAIDATILSHRQSFWSWTLIASVLGGIGSALVLAMLQEFGRAAAASILKSDALQKIARDASQP